MSSVEAAIALFRQQKNETLSVQQVLDCEALGNTIDSVVYGKIDENQADETCSKGGAAYDVFTGLLPGSGQQNLIRDSLLPYLGKLLAQQAHMLHLLLMHGLYVWGRACTCTWR